MVNKYVEEVMESHGHESLRETQQQALENGILDRNNSLLIAETGNGKTLCSEFLMNKTANEENGDIIYCVPSRQLVRDKKTEFSSWYSNEISINTMKGDGKIKIMTFEALYQHLIRGSQDNISLVVLDDFHEIYSSYRGIGIEKVITMCLEKDLHLLAMSATIGNPETLSSWMDAELIISNENRGTHIDEKFIEYTNSKSDCIVSLIEESNSKAPFLLFNSSRKNAMSRARKVSEEREEQSSKDYIKELREMMGDDMTDNIRELGKYMNNGKVAYHHAGLPSEVKEYVESEFKKGGIDIISSTTTIAYGFDAPVKSVIVCDLKRYDPGKGYMDYVNVWEYVQWIGRAARPGRGFNEGYAFIFCKNKDSAFERFSEENRILEDVKSHIEDTEEFRKFILELIKFDRREISSILDVIRETLYFQEVEEEGEWSEFFQTDKDEIIESRLRGAIEYLEKEDLIEKQHSRNEIKTTRLGEATVKFMLDNFVNTSIKQIRSVYNWIENNKLTKHRFLEKMCKEFQVSLGIESVSKNRGEIISIYNNIDEYSITSYVILEEWCSNKGLARISEIYGDEVSMLPNIASRLSKLINSTKYLFDVTGREPDWIDNLPEIVKYGIKEDHVLLVKEVEGLGRKRVRKLDEYVSEVASSNSIEYDNLAEGIYLICEKFGYKEWADVISNDVDGIGPKISSELVYFIETYH